MAGRGPAPKHPSQRRNRTKPERGEWLDLPPLEKPVLRDLPELDSGWRELTRLMWESWQNDPVTAMWGPADVAYALDTIFLHQEKPLTAANEIRLRMEALGLTPKGRQDRRWRIATEATEQAEDEMPKLADVRRLRAVDPIAS